MRPVQTVRSRLATLARSNPCDALGKAVVRGRSIYILPTASGLTFAAVLLVMLLGSLNYQNNLALLFTFLTTSIVLVAIHHTWLNLSGLSVAARGEGPVFAGETATFLLDLAAPGRRRRPGLQASPASSPKVLAGPVDAEPSTAAAMRVGIEAPDRGRQSLGRIRLETRYPLGLFRSWCYIDTPAQVTVYPRPADRSPTPPPVPTYRRSAAGDRGVGAEDFVGIRGYRPGDSPRQLDWKAFARERGLVVKQFGGDRADQVWLDWRGLPPLGVEARLRILCRQVLDCAQTGQSFGLRLPGLEIAMDQGEAHKHRCLDALARFRND